MLQVHNGLAFVLLEDLEVETPVLRTDYRKLQPRLLTKWPNVPIEVVPTAAPAVLRALRLLGSSKPFLRLGGAAKAGPIVTDNGNFIIDAPFATLLTRKDLAGQPSSNEAQTQESGPKKQWAVEALARRLKEIVGVVETGIFWGQNGQEAGDEGGGQKPVAAYFGLEDGEVVVRSASQL